MEQFLAIINLKHLKKHGAEVPSGFEKHLDSSTLTKIRNYTVEHGRVDRIAAFVSMAVTILFLFGGLMNWLNTVIAAQGWPLIPAGVIFFMLLFYGNTLINIPFSLYNTFSLEKRFGFTNQTFSLWMQDLAKSLVLNTLLLGFLLSVLLWLISTLPDLWWLAGWGFVLLFSIFLLYISPYVIEPLFNKFQPIKDTALEGRIKETMAKTGMNINRVYSMDASKRSSHSNAYFTGIGHVKRIVLFDTLLTNHTDDEIIAILAHEAGHWKKKHILKMLVFSQLIGLIGFYLAYRLTGGDFLAELFRLEIPTMHAKLLLVVFIGTLAMFPLKPLMTYISRRHEREADDFALDLTGNAEPMAEALIKLGKDNLANLHPHPLYAAVYYSHPPMAQRVKQILSAAQDKAEK
ncbi:MAG: M48 family metallopeptidase [Deltaproteobacteria bacterium]|jgi:STE24 endopeptidase|nr:M48 family metallopeptidase [Deltaproteobacteria bacterium]